MQLPFARWPPIISSGFIHCRYLLQYTALYTVIILLHRVNTVTQTASTGSLREHYFERSLSSR